MGAPLTGTGLNRPVAEVEQLRRLQPRARRSLTGSVRAPTHNKDAPVGEEGGRVAGAGGKELGRKPFKRRAASRQQVRIGLGKAALARTSRR